MKKSMRTGLKTILANNVRMHRQKQGLSQEKLAEICGYHRTYIGAIERGERNITLSTIEALADALDVSPTTLLTRQDKKR